MRILNQHEIAAVNGGLSITDVINAVNGKANTSIFASTETKIITQLIVLASPYLKQWFNDLIAKAGTSGTTTTA